MLSYQETPIQEIYDHKISTAGLKLLIKREDLNHRYVSGNKWWKLKYNLEEAERQQKKTLLTYGGAYSNHIYATAAAANEVKLKSVGLIRGEETFPLNPTLSFAKERGMELKYISRQAYRSKEGHAQYVSQFKDYYSIPEGGSNFLAVKGIGEFAEKLGEEFDYLCCPVGTGGTLAGLISGLDDSKKIVGFPILKGAHFLMDEIKNLIVDKNKAMNWQLVFDYHFGGYAKATPELFKFIDAFNASHNIPLEFIYTGKMMAGIYDLISKGFFQRGATILAIHTGGLQGKQFT
jgi:1-aminocyclopropane-1-carboxylate deaminase